MDVIPYVPAMVSAVGAVQTSPSVEFRDLGAAAGWDLQSSTRTTPLTLPSPWGALTVVVVVFGAMRP